MCKRILEKGHISTMQMLIFHQIWFFGITVSFHDNISKTGAQNVQNISCLCKWCSQNTQTSKLALSYYFLICTYNFSQMLLSVHWRKYHGMQKNKIKSSWCAEEPPPWYKRFFYMLLSTAITYSIIIFDK